MKSRTNQDVPVCAAFRALSSAGISIKISGNVLHSGIYTVNANSLAINVINMAEPLHPQEAYTIAPSAAPPLQNGSAANLGVLPDGTPQLTVGQMTVAERMILGIPLDIAVMNEADFDRLPGIGPTLARRIVAYRQNNGGILTVDDLIEIEGIGEKKYKVIRQCFQHAENTQ
jgi:competence protein ComEA